MTQPSGANSSLAEDLSSASEETFHAALRRVATINDLSTRGGVALVVDIVARLSVRDDLGQRHQADRIHALLQSIGLTSNALTELAHRARDFAPGLRNAISGFLSPEQRHILLRRDRLDGDPPQVATGINPSSPSASVDAANPSTNIAATAEPTDDGTTKASTAVGPFTTVALLASPFQDANTRRLTASGFGPIVWPSLEQLTQDLASSVDVCACLVDGSILQGLDKEQQRRLFDLLGGYSTFLWIRVDESHLLLTPSEIRDCLHKARCLREEVPAALLSIQPDGTLRDLEVGEIEAASRALRAGGTADFVPGELTPDEAVVLMAAARLHARELDFDGHVELRSLETRFLAGGRSSARIALLRVNRSGRPIVAKIDEKSRIQDEMTRFRTFIQPWDDALRPKVYFHGNAAVVLFGLVPNEQDQSKPAVVLESRLETIWNDQLFETRPARELDAERDALAEGVENAAKRLQELNSLKPGAANLPSLGNPEIASVLKNLADSGIDWALPAVARAAFENAATRFSKLSAAGTIHGDVHLRNILLRDDRAAHLIDYAGSGPGHPCVDLVRLELALFLCALRQVEPEVRFVDYQKQLTFDGASYETLREAFPALHRCRLNVVCSRGSVAARDRAILVVKVHGGDGADYQATKYLIAWQHLVMLGSHTGLARATIEALAPAIAAW